MEKENAPGREAEGVECLLGGDIDAYATSVGSLQFMSSGPGPILLKHWFRDEELRECLQ